MTVRARKHKKYTNYSEKHMYYYEKTFSQFRSAENVNLLTEVKHVFFIYEKALGD